MKLGTKNKGLTVKLNLWSLEKFLDDFDSRKARLWVIGGDNVLEIAFTRVVIDDSHFSQKCLAMP